MAKLVCAMNVSLDGYVDHTEFAPTPALFRHFIEEAAKQTGSLYGRRMYEIMRYWDDDMADWGEEERAFAAAWRRQPKWVASRTLESAGPNATLLRGDLESAVRALKAQHEGEIEVAGPVLAASVANLGLIDEYQLYVHPVVLGKGAPYFVGPRPRLRLLNSEVMDGGVMRLRYVTA